MHDYLLLMSLLCSLWLLTPYFAHKQVLSKYWLDESMNADNDYVHNGGDGREEKEERKMRLVRGRWGRRGEQREWVEFRSASGRMAI